MFTGMIEELGYLKSMIRGARSVKIVIRASKVLEGVNIGDSIAVNGTCLTVVEYTKDSFAADVMPETIQKTALIELKPGDAVNLERAVSLNTRLGGHIVSGHIDGIGEISNIKKDDNAIRIEIKVVRDLAKYIIKKGSVAIDGISLTVVDVTDTDFSISIIPHTAAMTTLGFKTIGNLVNIENDIIGKYVERLLYFGQQESYVNSNHITMDFLQKNGF